VAKDRSKYPNLIPSTRRVLRATDLPYVIENVKRAPLINPIELCGASFDLGAADEEGDLILRRHRLFESNLALEHRACDCRYYQAKGYKIAGCYGGARRTRFEAENVRHGGYVPLKPILDVLMGIDWMNERELFQAIPPAYTEWIGRQLIDLTRP
jgi:DNA (cytosine-5)-methyltransferase 1